MRGSEPPGISVGKMSIFEIIANFEGFNEECEHDKLHYHLDEAQRCYKCLLDRVMRQPPTVNTCFDLIYLENTLELDDKLQQLLRGCHHNDACDAFNLAQVMWDNLSCCSKQNLRSCSALLSVSAKVLTRIVKFLPSTNCFEFTRTMLIALPSVPEPCRDDITAAIIECVRRNPELAKLLQEEILQVRETMPHSLEMLMLTTQVLKFTEDFPSIQAEKYTESCATVLLNASEDDLRWRYVAASGLELVSKKHPEALERVPNQVLHSLFERFGSFDMEVVRRLCSTFTSAKLAAGFMRTKCLDKIFADCLLNCQDNLVTETVLNSLIASEQPFVELICANVNTIMHSLLSLLDTRSASRSVALKVLNLMRILFAQPRACLNNELLVAKVLHHCARNYDDSRDAQLAARWCFVSFLNGGHLSKKADFALASSAMSNCFSGTRELPLPELLSATLTFVEQLSSTSCQGAQETLLPFSLAFLKEAVPRITERIEEDRHQDNINIVSQFLRVVVIAVEHLKIHQETSLRAVIEPCVRRLWPLIKFRRGNSDAQRLLTLFVFVVGAHSYEEDFEIIETGFRYPSEESSHLEHFYAQLYLCHLDTGERVQVKALGENIDMVSSACRLWSPRLRNNMFKNIFCFLSGDMDKDHHLELLKLFLRFPRNPIDSEFLIKLPHLVDCLMTSKELKLHARKILLKACEERNVELIRYVLSEHPPWREFVVNCILTNRDVDEGNGLFRILLSTRDEVPRALLGSLVSILRMHLENGSPYVTRTLKVMVMAFGTTAVPEYTENMERDLKSLLYRLCSRMEDSENVSSTLTVLLAFLGSGSEKGRRELLEVIGNGTSFVQRAAGVNLAAALEAISYFAQVSPIEPVIVPALRLESLIRSTGVPSRTRRTAISVLCQAIDTKSSFISLDRGFSTDELLTITDDLLLNPLLELEAFELWSAIRKNSSDTALAAIIKERIRMALIPGVILSARVTIELLKYFRSSVKSSDAVRSLLPLLKKWDETVGSHP